MAYHDIKINSKGKAPKRINFNFTEFGRALLSPKRCLLCPAKPSLIWHLCDQCVDDISKIPSPCNRCGMPSPTGGVCGSCLVKPPEVDYVFAPNIYQGGLAQLIHMFKFKHSSAAGQSLAELLLGDVADLELPDVILATPQHWSRLLTRSFNPPSIIAKYLATKLNIPLDSSSLRKIKKTAPAKLLSKQERRVQLPHSFRVTKNFDGRHVVIVDDILTTGVTSNAIAKKLRQSGASKVGLWALGRTL